MRILRPRPLALVARSALAVIVGSGACGGRGESNATETAGGTSARDSTLVAPRAADSLGGGFPADTPVRPPVPRATPASSTTGSTTGAAPRPGASRADPPRGATNATPATGSRAPNDAPTSASREPRDTAAGRDTSPAAPPPAPGPPPIPPRPFGVGERLTYDVRFGPIRVGQASMEVLGIEQLRGRDAFHTRFLLRGGTAFFRVNDRYESWFDARTLESLRYAQQIDQGSYERERLFEMFPERRTFTENGSAEQQPSVADPLDDGSFLYFLRTIPLEVGTTYEFNRYFRPDRNPVRVAVLRRERVTVPAGTFDAIVVRPTIKTTGIFSEGGRAEVWFAADSTRRMLQMKSRLSFGSLNLYLRRVEP